MEPQTKLIVLDDTAWDSPATREAAIKILLGRGVADVAVAANSRFASGCEIEEDGKGFLWDRSWGAAPTGGGIEIAKMDYQRFAAEVARELAERGSRPERQGLTIGIASDERGIPESAERHVRRALGADREVVCLCGPNQQAKYQSLFPDSANLSLPDLSAA
jgi:hypothetical protein